MIKMMINYSSENKNRIGESLTFFLYFTQSHSLLNVMERIATLNYICVKCKHFDHTVLLYLQFFFLGAGHKIL